MVHDDAPFAFGVDCTQRLDVSCAAGAEVGLLGEVVQLVDGQGSIDDNVSVQSLNRLIVVVESLLHFSERIMRVFSAPSLGCVLGAFGNIFAVLLRVVVGWLVSRTISMNCADGHQQYENLCKTFTNKDSKNLDLFNLLPDGMPLFFIKFE